VAWVYNGGTSIFILWTGQGSVSFDVNIYHSSSFYDPCDNFIINGPGCSYSNPSGYYAVACSVVSQADYVLSFEEGYVAGGIMANAAVYNCK
jgi:hypothetical protein